MEGDAINTIILKVLGKNGIGILIPLTVATLGIDSVIGAFLELDGLVVLKEGELDVAESIGICLGYNNIYRLLNITTVEFFGLFAEGIG